MSPLAFSHALKRRFESVSGVALMLVASICFTAMSALVKALGPGFPAAEALMFRAVLSFPVLWMLLRGPLGAGARPQRPVLMLVRGLFGLSAMFCYFYALQRGVLANVMVPSRLQPVVIAMLAPLVLREQVPRITWIVLVISVVGVVLVSQPSAAGLDAASSAALLAACFSAVAHLALRRLNATDPPERIVFWFACITAVGGGAISAPVFVIPDIRQMLLLVGIAVWATAGQLLMTAAYGRDRAPVISSASHTSVVWGLILGLTLWGELPNGLALLGGAAILAAGMLLFLSRRGTVERPMV